MKVTDPVLQRVVPAALVSYRQLTEAYPHTAPAEAAFIRLAQYYDDMKRYDLQAQALTGLGSYFPKTRHDAWWEAGEIFERRLRDVAKAKDAYSTRADARRGGIATRRRSWRSCKTRTSFGHSARVSSAPHAAAGGGSWAPRGPQTRWARPRVVPLGSIPRPASPPLPGTPPLG